MTWNLFHGRDFPPDPDLFGWRSRLLRVTERNATHVQVNRDLLAEFSSLIAAARWDVCLLQECPPRWAGPLARACSAEPHRALTSRNSLSWLRALVARANPDLIASGEGGSNLTLVRGLVLERNEVELTPGPDPERRAMALTRARPRDLGAEICIANMHLSAGAANRAAAERELTLAAETAIAWAAGSPLILGGDLNLRPRDTAAYDGLARGHGLRAPTGAGSLDHLLARGLEPLAAPAEWPPQRRELRVDGLALRLSDHAPVQATFSLDGSG